MAKPNVDRRHGLRIRLLREGGAIFLNDALEPGDPPTKISVPVDYAERQDFITINNPRPVVAPAGPADKPFAKVHTFVHADELVLRMKDSDYHYAVVGQPGKYDSAGKPTDKAGDPTSEVRWYYDADLVVS
jgi:hypothetical protein